MIAAAVHLDFTSIHRYLGKLGDYLLTLSDLVIHVRDDINGVATDVDGVKLVNSRAGYLARSILLLRLRCLFVTTPLEVAVGSQYVRDGLERAEHQSSVRMAHIQDQLAETCERAL
jgi:hypothetical protein